MIRVLPHAVAPLPPGGLPSPADAIAWVLGIPWLTVSSRAAAIHLDGRGRLAGLSADQASWSVLGYAGCERVADDAVGCRAAAVLAVDLRSRLPAAGVSDADRRRHADLAAVLALRRVALLDTLIIAAGRGRSVADAHAYDLVCSGGGRSSEGRR